MPARGTKHAPAALGRNGRISEGTRRGLKPWNDGLLVLSHHVRRFLRSGQVTVELRPMVADATATIGEYAEQLGGEEQLVAGQRMYLRQLWQILVAKDALHSRVIRTGDVSVLVENGFATLLAAERACISALGLERVAKNVPRLDEYLASKQNSEATLDVEPEPEREESNHE